MATKPHQYDQRSSDVRSHISSQPTCPAICRQPRSRFDEKISTTEKLGRRRFPNRGLGIVRIFIGDRETLEAFGWSYRAGFNNQRGRTENHRVASLQFGINISAYQRAARRIPTFNVTTLSNASSSRLVLTCAARCFHHPVL